MSAQKAKQAKAKDAGRLCSVAGCETGALERGMCGYHVKKARAEERAARGDVCSLDDCVRGRFARGLCRGHYTTAYGRERRAAARSESALS